MSVDTLPRALLIVIQKATKRQRLKHELARERAGLDVAEDSRLYVTRDAEDVDEESDEEMGMGGVGHTEVENSVPGSRATGSDRGEGEGEEGEEEEEEELMVVSRVSRMYGGNELSRNARRRKKEALKRKRANTGVVLDKRWDSNGTKVLFTAVEDSDEDERPRKRRAIEDDDSSSTDSDEEEQDSDGSGALDGDQVGDGDANDEHGSCDAMAVEPNERAEGKIKSIPVKPEGETKSAQHADATSGHSQKQKSISVRPGLSSDELKVC